MATNNRRKAAASSGAAAARSRNTKKTVEFEGLTLTLPPKLPFRCLRHMRGETGLEEVLNFLEDALGAEQMEEVWNLDLDVTKGTERGMELAEEILGLYGMSVEKAPASSRS